MGDKNNFKNFWFGVKLKNILFLSIPEVESGDNVSYNGSHNFLDNCSFSFALDNCIFFVLVK